MQEQQQQQPSSPMAAWFLGPKSEHAQTWADTFNFIFQDYIHWRRNYFPEDDAVLDRQECRQHEAWFDDMNNELDKILNHLKADYPFYSPRYIAHMISELSLPSMAGYFAGMLYNPNNVSHEAAPITMQLEIEAGKMIGEMLGYDPTQLWAHITSGGTIANLEALWAARKNQTLALAVQAYCQEQDIDFHIHLPNGQSADIRSVAPLQLWHLKPAAYINMPAHLAAYLIHQKRQPAEIVLELDQYFRESKFNINKSGLLKTYMTAGVEPIIYVSATAHYSIKKSAALLGIGEEQVRLIPVHENFRMNVAALEQELWSLTDNQIVIAVIAIAGTTEEGSVDPVHEVVALRERYEQERNRSFWLHVDAAWGGYVRSLMKGYSQDPDQASNSPQQAYKNFVQEAGVNLSFQHFGQAYRADWEKEHLYQSFLHVKFADSITIDPHKLGYTPYPAGVVCFKHGRITEQLTQKAQYITDERGGLQHPDHPFSVHSVGPYIVEGSKPGAAAASTWLAHKTIPLHHQGHGKIIKHSLLYTQKLWILLKEHRQHFQAYEELLFGEHDTSRTGFSFEPLYEPDTNLLCYIARPYIWSAGKFIPKDVPLSYLNQLNRQLYELFSIRNEGNKHKMPYMQEFFVSRTQLFDEQYTYASMKPLLERFGIGEAAYKTEGMFVLRSTVMNPWHEKAADKGTDYLEAFIQALHKKTRYLMEIER